MDHRLRPWLRQALPLISAESARIRHHNPQIAGSEFAAVVIPLATQHYLLPQRNLIYTGVTRGKELVIVVGQQKALAIALRNNRTEQRFSGLLARLREFGQNAV